MGRRETSATRTTPVFWYKPHGSETYRVIYGDLSARDLAPQDAPQPEGDKEGK